MATEKVYSLKIDGIEQSISSVEELENAVAELDEKFRSAEFGSDEFNQLQKDLQAAKSELDEFDASVQGVTSAQRAEGFLKLGQAAAGAFTIAAVGLEAFGASTEEVEKLQAKMTGLIAALDGVKLITEALSAENLRFIKSLIASASATVKNTLSTAANTTAKIADTAAEKGNTVAKIAATAATKALNAAIKAGPLLIIGAVLTAAAAAWALFADNAEDATKAIEEQNDRLKTFQNRIKSIREEEKKEGQKEIERRQQEIELAELDIKIRLAAGAKEKEVAEDRRKIFQLQKDLQEDIIKRNTEIFKQQVDLGKIFTLGIENFVGLQQAIDAVSKEADTLRDKIRKAIRDRDTEAEENYRKRLEEIKNTLEELTNRRDEGNKSIADARFELEKLEKELAAYEASLNNSTDATDKNTKSNKKNTQSLIELSLAIGKKTLDKNLKNLEVSQKEQTRIINDGLLESLKNEELTQDEVLKLKEEANKKILESQINFKEQEILVLKAFGQDTLDAEIELQQLRIQLRGEGAEEEAEVVKKTFQEKFAEIAAIAVPIITELANLANSIINLQLQQLDFQLAALDERLNEAALRSQDRVSFIESIEEDLETARGRRRENLLEALETERETQIALAAEEAKIAQQREALEKRQAQLRKKQALTGAIINTALGVTSALGSSPPPINFILAALVAAAGALEVATISKQQFAKGGLLDGPSHKSGGIRGTGSFSGIEVEGGEFIVNKRSTSSNAGILRTINDNPNGRFSLSRVGQDGGVLTSGVPSGVASSFGDDSTSRQLEALNARIAQIDIRPQVSVVDINEGQTRVDVIESAAQI